MPNIDHLSYSSISSYLLCARAWKYRYVDKAHAPTAPALLFGSAFHDATEAYMLDKGGSAPLNHWAAAWGRTLENPRNADVDWGMDVPAEIEADGPRMLGAKKVVDHLADIKARGVREVEKRVELRVPGVPVPIIGYIDLITTDGVPGDFKTAARMWADAKAEEELQPLFYLAALNQQGIETPGWTFRHYVYAKGKDPYGKTFEVQHSPMALFGLFELIQSTWEAISANAYPMNGVGSWKCGPKYCEWWPQCRGKWA